MRQAIATLQGAQRVRAVKTASTDPLPHHDAAVTARAARRGYGQPTFHSSS
jgi:hypothetical protein